MEEDLRKSHDELEEQVQERTAELSTAIDKLRVANRDLQEFVFVASHDLEEPLRKVETFSRLVRERSASSLGEKERDYLDRAINATRRMKQLLRALLSLSRVSTRTKPFEKIDPKKIALEAAEDLEITVLEKKGRIEIEDMPSVEADENQFQQLFQNLIGNALKFQTGRAPLVQIYSRPVDERFIEIFVKDNGIGFDPANAERIFNPFERLHGRSEYKGLGMGLAICRKIVERHGGTIRAESEPGKGSIFIIKLPLKQAGMEGREEK
jgi:light-regulated signal transduction histidine kinase (bacteriophytochrome)